MQTYAAAAQEVTVDTLVDVEVIVLVDVTVTGVGVTVAVEVLVKVLVVVQNGTRLQMADSMLFVSRLQEGSAYRIYPDTRRRDVLGSAGEGSSEKDDGKNGAHG